jgi:DNA-binding MarR family transcriptional regulator
MLLQLLWNGCIQEESLSKKLNMKSLKFKKLVLKLTKKGLIHRFHINKSKSYQIVLSKYGIKKSKKIDFKYKNQISKYFQVLDELQKQQLEMLLEKLINNDENKKIEMNNL